MAYISSEEVKAIRSRLKKELYRFKLSVTKEHHTTLRVTFLAGPLDFGATYTDVNAYHLDKHWGDKPEAHALLQRVVEIVRSEAKCTWYDDSDYGSMPSYYTDISIGRFGQPYQLMN